LFDLSIKDGFGNKRYAFGSVFGFWFGFWVFLGCGGISGIWPFPVTQGLLFLGLFWVALEAFIVFLTTT